MLNKVFISYANEDIQYANLLHDFLLRHGYKPWMDKKDILPGQAWDFKIQEELRKADFIILLLSSNSVSKRGYIQREFTKAVLYCEEKLESDIYIIPIKINSCEIPEKLSKFQWLEYTSDESFYKIVESLNSQKSKIQKEQNLLQASIIGIDIQDKIVSGEYGEKSPKQRYEINYQLFKEKEIDFLREVNIKIESEVLNYLIRSRDNYFNFLKDISIDPDDDFGNEDSTCYGNINFQFIHKDFISFTGYWSLYETRAIHGNYWTRGHNYLLNPLRSLDLKNLFNDVPNAIKKLRDVIDGKLMERARLKFGAEEHYDFYLLEDGLTTDIKNFENFYFKKNSWVFIYNTYQLTSFSLGDHHIEISFNELKDIFPEEQKLLHFISAIA